MAVRTQTYISLFAGAGGLDFGLHIADRIAGSKTRCVCYVEIEAYGAAILAAAMENGILPPAPIWSDVQESRGAGHQVTIAEQAEMWTIPQAHDSTGGSPERVGRLGTKHGGANLADDVLLWPTPAARDVKGTNSQEHALETGGGRKHMDQLPNFVEHSFQPSLQDRQTMRRGKKSLDTIQDSPQQPTTEQSSLWQTPRTGRGEYQCDNGDPAKKRLTLEGQAKKRLNPTFTEWLMGFPLLHTAFERTDFERWEMESCRLVQQWLGRYYGEDLMDEDSH